MEAREFLKLVEHSMPAREALVDHGLTDEEIDDIQGAFRSTRREAEQPLHPPASGLERMIVENDCSALVVSQLRFLARPKPHPGGVAVALWEADPIVVLPTGAVGAFDHANPAASPVPCARDSEAFLAALAFLVEVSANKAAWRGRATEAADTCAGRAGGGAYRGFFGALCAFLE